MSKASLFLRVVLVLLVAAVIFLSYRMVARNRPGYYWGQAQAALEAGDLKSARVHLLNLLKREPDHGEGHRALAQLCLDEVNAVLAEGQAGAEAAKEDADDAGTKVAARPARRKVRYAQHPAALHHLVQAANARPDDLDLQKQALVECLAARHMANAATIAARVIDSEPDNSDALYALAWQAVERKDAAEARRLMENLEKAPARHVFATFALAVQQAEREQQPDRAQAVLAQATQTAARLTEAQYRSLTAADLETMLGVFLAAVRQAPDAAAARGRAAEAVGGLETAAKARPSITGRAAETASQILLLLSAPRPSAARAAAPEAKPAAPAPPELAARVEKLRAAAIERGNAAPVVYHQSAAAALARGDFEASLALLNKGLQVGARLPSERRKELLELHRLAAWELVMLRRFSQAEEHLKVLLAADDKAMVGWGHLLTGYVAGGEGKLEKARDHLLRARNNLGDTPQVRAALANVFLAMRQWSEALPHLASLHVPADALSPEERAWRNALVGSEERIHLAELRARLGLNRWQEAQSHLDALNASELAPQAEFLAVAWLAANGQETQANERLAEARRRFPRHVGLLDLELTALERAGRIDQARSLIEQYAAAAPDDLVSQLALCGWRLKHQEAEKVLQHLADLEKRLAKTPEDKLRIMAIKAQALLAAGKPKEAETVAAALRADPRATALADLFDAAAQWSQNNPQGAADALAAAGKASPRSGVVSLFQGEIEMKQGDYAEGMQHLARALEVTALRQRAGAALLQSVVLLASQKPLPEVEAKVDELLRRSPDDPILLLAKADLAIRQGRFDAGIALLDRVERVEPKSPAGPYFKAQAFYRAGQPDRAAANVRRALALEPKHLPSLVLAAQASLAGGDFPQALAHARAALAERPGLPEAVLVEAEALERTGRHDEALRAVEGLVDSQPGQPTGYAALGMLHAAAGQVDKALEAYRRGLEKLPNEPSLRLGEIGLLARSGRVDEAHKVAQQALSEKPDSALATAVAQTFAAAGRAPEARSWCEKVLAIGDPRQKAAAHFVLGNIALREAGDPGDPKRLAEARDHFAAVVAAEPTDLIAANNLAWLLADEFGQPKEAVAVLEKAKGPAAVGRLPAAVVHTLAVAYRKAGRGEDALRALEEALAAHPNDATLLIETGSILAERERFVEAKAALRRAMQLGASEKQSARAKEILANIEAKAQTTP